MSVAPPELRELSEIISQRDDSVQVEALIANGGGQFIADRLKVNTETGITSDRAASLREKYGENRVPDRKPKLFFELVLAVVQDLTIYMLIASCIISLIVWAAIEQGHGEGWMEVVAIACTIVLVALVGGSSDYKKELEFRKLNQCVQNSEVSVIRDGVATEISKYEVVVGDVIRLKVGDILEADGLILEGHDVQLDESALTGEPILIKKTAKKPFMLSGTAVQRGQGKYLVTGVGFYSENGRIQALVRKHEIPPMDEKDRLKMEKKKGDKGKGKKKSGDKKKVESKMGENPTPDELLDLDEALGTNPLIDDEGSNADEDSEESPLTQKLNEIAWIIGRAALFIALVTFIGMLISHCVRAYGIKGRQFDESFLKPLRTWLVSCVTIVVVAVPEGLPLAVTLSLALSVSKMQKDQNLVKHLGAAETMGSATTICSDKTGTLTQNKMTVIRAYVSQNKFEASSDSTAGEILGRSTVDQKIKEAIGLGICLNKAEADIKWDEKSKQWTQIGNKTDCALLAFAHDIGYQYIDVRKQEQWMTEKNGTKQIGCKTYAFSSERKRADLAVPLPDGKFRLYVKGASEMILSLTEYEQVNDERCERQVLDKAAKEKILTEVINVYAKNALRTIALAYRDFDTEPNWDVELEQAEAVKLTGQSSGCFQAETGLTLLGLVGIADPLRPTVPQAIKDCSKAGVDVRMVTGDNKDTAIAIAAECGILRVGKDVDEDGNLLFQDSAMTGIEFRKRVLDQHGNLKQQEFDAIWPYLRVLARSSPTDKHTLVDGMMQSNLFQTEKGKKIGVYPDRQVVAVTGDGTNDAPALSRSDVGFAMGIAGTSVAKDAADIILLDDDFASIVKAVSWGRNVFDSITKFLQFQLTINIVAVFTAVIGGFSYATPPMTPVQLLWVNVIMDTLGAFAMAAEPPTPDLLERQPYGRNRFVVSRHMMMNILGHSVYQLVVILIFMFAGSGAVPADLDEGVFRLKNDFEEGGLLNVWSGFGRPHNDRECVESDKYKELCHFNGKANTNLLNCPCMGVEPSLHFTFIFNAFVLMQLFNWLNCRKLYHEWNPFAGLQNNITFIVVWIFVAFIQCFFVIEFGGMFPDAIKFNHLFMKTQPLTQGPAIENRGNVTNIGRSDLWSLSVLIGLGSFPVQFIIILLGKLFFKDWLQKDFEMEYTIAAADSKDLENGGPDGGVPNAGDIRFMYSGMSGRSNHSKTSAGSKLLLNTPRTQRSSQHLHDFSAKGSKPKPALDSSGSASHHREVSDRSIAVDQELNKTASHHREVSNRSIDQECNKTNEENLTRNVSDNINVVPEQL